MADSESLRLDPDYTSALITQAAQLGAQGSATGAPSPANGIGMAGVSPVDGAAAGFDTSGIGDKAGWSSARALTSITRTVGGQQGVTALTHTETHNADLLHDVGES